MIGKLDKVPLREIWRHEAYDFTSWLTENLDTLSEILGFEILNPIREHGTENFNVDIVAEDDSGNMVVIENQLEKSNHDHLGKIITYLSAVGANTAIWIVAEPRQEHIKAIAWLNESELASFYLLKFEVVKIGDSRPAPLFTLIVGPSEEARSAGETKKQYAEKNHERREFWAFLLEKAKTRSRTHVNISPGLYQWIGTSVGIAGINYNYIISKPDGKVEFYIDRDKETGEKNRLIFDFLLESKEQIENEFGAPLSWEPLEGKRACRIAKYYTSGGYMDKEKWPQITDEMIDGMIKLTKVMDPYINKIRNLL